MGHHDQSPGEKEIFETALDIEGAGQRERYLRNACGADARLLERVQQLLRAHEARDFLPDKPAAGVAGETGTLKSTIPLAPLDEQPGTIIGRYKLLEKIGEGGFGVVYVAEQREPVKRRIALKIIKLGMDTKEVVARFEAERQALALMDHPNIAKVLDAGSTESGRPYFVMELVRGIKLTAYCDQNNLPTIERLKLFIQICHAIQHAHQKGIIHRDIKPSNILVTLHDGVPVPKVIDFGIAKATQFELTEKTVYTQLQQFIGTPAYMSPEQAEMSGLDIDTRSDIYSLGVLLYELLTSRTPFDGKELMKRGLEEIVRTIREVEPPRPSTRLNTLAADELTTAAKRRGIEAPKLFKLLRGDLDWIVMKCLEKDRTRRYETANGVAADLKRFLENEPVVARPPSKAYQLQKLVRRNKTAFAAAAVVLAALIVGLGVSTWSFIRERTARTQVEQARANETAALGVAKQKAEAEAVQRARAEDSAAQARAAATRLEIEKAEQLFEKDDSATALAILARILRQNPSNRVAAERVLSALGNRNYCLPALAPLTHGAPATNRVSEGDLYSGLHAFRHSGSITFAQFSPDGERVLTASKDRTARLWDSRTGTLLFEFRHGAEVLCAQFSPDGQRIVTASLDKAAQTWSTRTGQRDLPPLRHEGGVVFAEFSVTGEQVVTASEDYTARIWRADTGENVHVFKHTNTVYFARLTPDGQILVAATIRGQIAFWDTATGERSPRQLAHLASGFAMFGYPAFSPRGDQLWTRDYVRELSRQLSLNGLFGLNHDRVVNAVDFSPDGLSLASASDDHTAMVWNIETGKPMSGPLRHLHAVLHVRFSPDGRRLVTSSRDNTVRVWDARTGRPEIEPLRHDSRVFFAEFSPDGRRILTLPQGTSAWIWELRTGQPVTQPLRHANPVLDARFSSDGRRIATGADTGGARVWNAATFDPVTTPILSGSQYVNFSPDGTRLLTFSERSSTRIWNAITGQQEGPPLRHDRNVSVVDSAQFSPDSQYVVTAGRDKTARIWTATSGVERIRFVHDSEVRSARFSADGQRVLTACYDSTARIWDAISGTNLITLRHDGSVLLAEYNADGSRIITASLDATARIWDAPTGRLLHTLRHDAALNDVHSVQFNSDSSRVITVSRNAVQVWDARTGATITPALVHPLGVNSAKFSPNEDRIVTACQDGVARIWVPKIGHSVGEPLRHDKAVSYAEFSPDGHWVVTASHDGTVGVWEVPSATGPVPSWLPELAEACAGQRLRDESQMERVPLDSLLRLKQHFAATAGGAPSDTYTRWANWFFAASSTRSITPSSQVSISNFVRAQIHENTPASLEKALSLAPDNALAEARLALIALTNEATPSSNQMNAADWRTARALSRSPHDPEMLWTRADVCERLGRFTEALETMERASHLNPTNALFWYAWGRMLDKTNRVEEALLAYSKSIELSGAWQGSETLPGRALRSRSKLLERFGRPAEARRDDLRSRNIADRPARTPRNLIDLTPYYTSGFGDLPGVGEDYFTPDPRPFIQDGIEFDLRGIIHVNSGVYWEINSPASVRGIAIGQKCRQLFFLHIGCNGDTPVELLEGRTIAEYRMRYVDGVEVAMPIVYGHHVRDEYPSTDTKPLRHSGSAVGWLGIRTGGSTNRLFRTAWNNPRPDVMIESLDFITHSNKVVPFLFAITAEP